MVLANHHLNKALLIAFIALGVVLLLFGGCSPRDIPADEPRPTLKAWLPVSGESMQPIYPNGMLAEVIFGVRYADLKKDQDVVVWDYVRGAEKFTFHRLIRKQGDQWVTRGLNPDTNKRYDAAWLTKDNFYAVATGNHTQTLNAPLPR